MASKYQQGLFEMKNPSKYIGKHTPRYRSSWELKFMRVLDAHPNVVAWASESHRIPYVNPLTRKSTVYVPDFFMVYEDKAGNRKAEFIEIKPAGQIIGKAKSVQQKAAAIINEAKWQAARAFAERQGVGFRVLTENELFNNAGKK
tara:strand:+ start:5281 stop:5715 length:435 start_codon:yes stop_codon:yes gene_type:complete